MRRCRSCGVVQDLEQFTPRSSNSEGRGYKCRACRRADKAANREKVREQSRAHYRRNREAIIAKTKAWHLANPERSRQLAREGMRRLRVRDREHILEAYGRACTCCGETEPLFLALDHVNDDGSKHRAGLSTSLYRDVIRRGCPPEFQLLCFNCNMAKARGGCPHKGRPTA